MNTVETSTKLKDCPFCGGKALMAFNGANGRVIKCKSCQVKMQQKVLGHTVEWLEIEMVKDWNKRQEKTNIIMKTEIMNVKVNFFSYEWDNYQGASGKVIELERLITLDDDIKLSEVKSEVIFRISQMGYKDDWSREDFSGRGIISVTIF